MATLAEVITTRVSDVKRRPLVAVGPTTTVGDVVAQLHDARRGAVVIVDGDDVIGIFTARDLMLRVNHAGDGWRDTPIRDVMTESPVTVRPDQTLEHAMNLMVAGSYRHLPVVDAGKLVSVLSIRDVLRFMVSFFPKEFLNQPTDPDDQAHEPWGG